MFSTSPVWASQHMFSKSRCATSMSRTLPVRSMVAAEARLEARTAAAAMANFGRFFMLLPNQLAFLALVQQEKQRPCQRIYFNIFNSLRVFHKKTTRQA